MKVTGSTRAIKVLLTVLALSAVAMNATACTSCTMNEELDSSDGVESTLPPSETTTPITGPDGTLEPDETMLGGGMVEDTRVNESTHRVEETTGLLGRLL